VLCCAVLCCAVLSSDPCPGSVPLSEGDVFRLAQLQRQLEAEDPVLARTLRSGHPPDCDRDAGGLGRFIVAMAIALLMLPLLYVVAVGAVLVLIAALAGWVIQPGVRWRHPPVPIPHQRRHEYRLGNRRQQAWNRPQATRASPEQE
jgi:Protein of unknown function (DUF3040)